MLPTKPRYTLPPGTRLTLDIDRPVRGAYLEDADFSAVGAAIADTMQRVIGVPTPPKERGLPPQVRDPSECLSAMTVLKNHFVKETGV